ncbi:MAG: type I 3-dehydroquinate dehydratase [Phycisphaerales bacterium]|nr:type I 3-dehydroquinate dehydratase [Phycisphaerales bacterium]
MSTLLCIPIMVQDEPSALADAGAAKGAGADLVEFRIDDVFSGSGDEREEKLVLRLCAQSPLPCIVTCRAAAEGGNYDGDDMARVSLYERLGTASGPGELPPRYLDIEHAAYSRSANLRQKINLAVDHPAQVRDLRTGLILSMHDFQARPADLTRRLIAMRGEGAASVLKVAYRARSLRDNLELFDLLAERDRPMIALGMGEFGLMSRILAPKFGGFLTFASLRPTTTTAPGQPTVAELLDLYRFRSIGPATKVYGVVGWPVGHSMSPLIHNAGFGKVGHDGVYVPLPIPTGEGGAGGYESFKATMLELVHHPRLDFSGCSVTLPHKEHLVRLAEESGWELDDVARAVGAGNTLIVERAAGCPIKLSVQNTDVHALRDAIGPVSGLRVGVIGAGGVARAAIIAMGAAITVAIYGRTLAKAEALVRELEGRVRARLIARELAMAAGDFCDRWVNCTPVGMTGGPAVGESAIAIDALMGAEGEVTVLDTVYNPVETPLLKAARARGWKTVDGVEMFVRQAAAQFEAWTGKEAPIRLFDWKVREHLARDRSA